MKVIIENGVTVIKTGDQNGGVKNKFNKTGVSQHFAENGDIKYRAEIQISRKKYFLGLKDTPEEAGELRKEAERQLEAETFFEWFDSLKQAGNLNGHRGIERRMRSDGEYSYKALLTYKKKKYQIGTRRTIEEAVALRKEAEKHVESGDFLEWLEELKKR